MSLPASLKRNSAFLAIGLGVALVISTVLSPFASQDPDGLDRVAQDLKFNTKEDPNPPSHALPFRRIFDQYSLNGVPQQFATPLAGLTGTLAVFGIAWGVGKLAVRNTSDADQTSSLK